MHFLNQQFYMIPHLIKKMYDVKLKMLHATITPK